MSLMKIMSVMQRFSCDETVTAGRLRLSRLYGYLGVGSLGVTPNVSDKSSLVWGLGW